MDLPTHLQKKKIKFLTFCHMLLGQWRELFDNVDRKASLGYLSQILIKHNYCTPLYYNNDYNKQKKIKQYSR